MLRTFINLRSTAKNIIVITLQCVTMNAERAVKRSSDESIRHLVNCWRLHVGFTVVVSCFLFCFSVLHLIIIERAVGELLEPFVVHGTDAFMGLCNLMK